jgi:hypothetical protein
VAAINFMVMEKLDWIWTTCKKIQLDFGGNKQIK